MNTLFGINLFVCLLLLTGIGFEAFLILKRNRTIRQPGKDDFMMIMFVIVAVILIVPLNNATSAIEAMRNVLILVFLFGTLAIKRGVNEKGIVKSFFFIPWQSVKRIHVDRHHMHQARITFKSGWYSPSLIVPIFALAGILDYVGAYCPDILIETTVQDQMKSMPQLKR